MGNLYADPFEAFKDLTDDLQKGLEEPSQKNSQTNQEENLKQNNSSGSNEEKWNLYELYHQYKPDEWKNYSVWSSLETCGTRKNNFTLNYGNWNKQGLDMEAEFTDIRTNDLRKLAFAATRDPGKNIVHETLTFNDNGAIWKIDWKFLSNSHREVINYTVSSEGKDWELIKDGIQVADYDFGLLQKSNHGKKIDQESFYNYKCGDRMGPSELPKETQVAYQNLVNKKQKAAKEFAASPEGVGEDLKGSYILYIGIKECYETRKDYDMQYVRSGTFKNAQKQIKTIEDIAKKNAPSIDADKLWQQAITEYPKTLIGASMIGAKLVPNKWSKDAEQACNIAVAGLKSDAPKEKLKKDF